MGLCDSDLVSTLIADFQVPTHLCPSRQSDLCEVDRSRCELLLIIHSDAE